MGAGCCVTALMAAQVLVRNNTATVTSDLAHYSFLVRSLVPLAVSSSALLVRLVVLFLVLQLFLLVLAVIRQLEWCVLHV